MKKHYIFFTRNQLPQPDAAHLVHDVHTANAVANLGYSAILVYLKSGRESVNPVDWVTPFRLRSPSLALQQFYCIQDHLKICPLAVPFPIGEQRNKWLHTSTLVCKYYFPRHLFRRTHLLHTLDWNLAKTAIRHQVPVIYEREHDQDRPYEPDIVNHPLFLLAVTVADSVGENMVANGMPRDKILKLHLGFNQAFAMPQPEQAQEWRSQLLKSGRTRLVVYSGSLYRFKGVDDLLAVARNMPKVEFVFAGGDRPSVESYQHKVNHQRLTNVTFLGHVPQHRLVSLLQAADVLVHPHRSGDAAQFTSPLKLFDYIASGVPIVATTIPPLEEFRASGVIAGWCAPDTPLALQHQIEAVLDAPPNSRTLMERQVQIQQFSWETRLKTIFSTIDARYLPPLRSP